jgi:Tfp pilus assembly protein PilO
MIAAHIEIWELVVLFVGALAFWLALQEHRAKVAKIKAEERKKRQEKRDKNPLIRLWKGRK